MESYIIILLCLAAFAAGFIDAIVGGGDASVKGVNLAGQYAKKIFLLVLGSNLIRGLIGIVVLSAIFSGIKIC